MLGLPGRPSVPTAGPADPLAGSPDLTLVIAELCKAQEHLDRVQGVVITALVRCGVLDLTPRQLAILYLLSLQDQQPSKLSKVLFHRDKQIAHHVKQLLARGLVEEYRHSVDRRAKLLHLTPRGLELLRRLGIAEGAARTDGGAA
ncbi:winged helix DNA-binding protein [Azospirillum thermophilum]|nr:winged helix DNA-binding protein [Azospirillum thermophilum]